MTIIVLFVCLVIGVTIGARLERASGGMDIKIEDAPFFVSIRRRGRHDCSGAFISTQHVLTAANCVLDESFRHLNDTTVMSGTDKKYGMDVGHEIINISPHEDFLKGIFWCNIAVITLSAHVEWNEKRNAIPLPNAEPPHNKYAILVAFKWRMSDIGDSDLTVLSVQIENPEPAAEVPRHLDPTFRGIVARNKNYMENPGTHGTISMADRGAPLIYEGRIVGIVATTSQKYRHASFFVNIFACETFIKKSMGQIASSSSELTSETSSPAKRRRLNP